MKLFGHYDSGHALKVKFFLDWLNIDHEYELVDIYSKREDRSTEFLTASKFAEVPTLIDDNNYYTQSNAILVYLAEKFAVFHNDKHKQENLQWLVWEANKIGLCLPQLRCHDRLTDKNPNFKLSQGAYDWLINRYRHDVNVLDNELRNQKFILGEQVSPADFSLSAYLLYADEINNIEVPKNVAHWLDRMRNLNGWQSPYIMLS